MDHLKVARVEKVQLEKGQASFIGNLHLTAHHLIFDNPELKKELWITYPTIHTVEKGVPTVYGRWPLHIRCHDFVFVRFSFEKEQQATDVYETIQKLTCVGSVQDLYAFYFTPDYPKSDGWKIYDPESEFKRMGVEEDKGQWRLSSINQSYSFSPTYPHIIVVPSKISDNVLQYAAKYRSKARIPALSYLHWLNKASITRCSQPMVGLKQNRSIQDEKLIEAIFLTTVEPPKGGQRVYSNTATNLIIDARPTANAVVNTAVGAGTENMENYRNCKKSYSGIDNIHVMRESLNKLVEALQELDQKGWVSKAVLQKSGWLKHITTVMDGAIMIVRNIHIYSSHVLVHCSDGWDRTAQLTSIAQVCLDPYYRTLRGFQVLVEKEWCSFGHKFMDRCGHLSNDKNFVSLSATNSAANTFANVQSKLYNNKHIRETSPVFQQFLDSVYQIMYQFPTRFEYNEDFLIQLHYHVYSCQFGNFLFNCERERELQYQAAAKTASIWDFFNANKDKYLNPQFDPTANRITEGDQGVLFPDSKTVRYWAKLFNREDDELNGLDDTTLQPGGASATLGMLAPGERMTPEMLGFSANYVETAVSSTDLTAGGPGLDVQESRIGVVRASGTLTEAMPPHINGFERDSSSLPPTTIPTNDPLGLSSGFDGSRPLSARSNLRPARANNFSEAMTSDDAWNAAKAGAAAIGGGIVDTFSRISLGMRETWYATSSAPSASSPSSLAGGGAPVGMVDGDDGDVSSSAQAAGGSGGGNSSIPGGPLGGIGGLGAIGGAMFGQRSRSATLGQSHSNRRKGTVDRELMSVAGHTPTPAFQPPSSADSSPRPSLTALTLEDEIFSGRGGGGGRGGAGAPTSRSASPAARTNSGSSSHVVGVRTPRTSSPAPGGVHITGGGIRGGGGGFDPLSNPATFAPPPPSPPSSPLRPPNDGHPLGTPSPSATATAPSAMLASVSVLSNGSAQSSPQSSKVAAATFTFEPLASVAVVTTDKSSTLTETVVLPQAPPAKELPHPLFIE